ncbi:MAG: hypothetical protein IT384_10070 [Deltaproteobacteria bacterium]|nr:hypothetical protein [Deltaproteobacteria bacterium]
MLRVWRPALLLTFAACSAGTDSFGPAGGHPPGAPRPSASANGWVYVATTGINRPGFVPVGAGGPAERRTLGPSRGAGYGMGEGSLGLIGFASAGAAAIVSFGALDHRGAIFRLELDGSRAGAPLKLADLTRPDRSPTPYAAISADARRLAFLDDGALYTVAVDGSSAPVRATSGIPAPRSMMFSLEGDRLVVQTEDDRVLATELSEGSAPMTLASGDVYLAGVLPGGRALIRHGHVFYAHSLAGGGPAVRLTPEGGDAGRLVGVLGGDAIATDRATPFAGDPERLVMFDLDGRSKDAPTVLSPSGATVRDPVLIGDRVLFVASEAGTSGLYEVAVARGAVPRPLGPRHPGQLYLLHVTDSALVLCDDGGRPLAIDRATPGTLRELPSPSPGQCPVAGVTGAGRFAVLGTPSTTYVLQPIDGAAAIPLPTTPTAVLDEGIFCFDYAYQSSAVFRVGAAGPEPLTPWLERSISEAVMSHDDTVIYRTAEPDPRWHVARIDGGDREQARPIAPPGVGDRLIGTLQGRAVLSGTTPIGSELFAPLLDGSEARDLAPLLDGQWVGGVELHAPSGRVIAQLGERVVSVRIDGQNAISAPVLFEGWTEALLADAEGSAVYASDAGGVSRAVVDGSSAPTRIAEAAGATELRFAPSRDRLVMVLSTLDTAVPHPYQLMVARVDGSDRGAPVQIGPARSLPIARSHTGDPWDDRGWMLISDREAVYEVELWRPSEATLLLALGDRMPEVLGGYGPNGRGMIALVGEDLLHLMPGGVETLGRPRGYARAAVWSPEGDALLLASETIEGLHISRVSPGGDGLVPAADFPSSAVAEVVGPSPLGDGLVIKSRASGDRSLYLVPWRGDPRAVTPLDDAEERLVTPSGLAR